MTKKCSECEQVKSLSEFPKRKAKLKDGTIKDSIRSTCKECYNKYFRVYMKGNKIHQSRVLKNRTDQKRKIAQDKLDNGCLICGYNKCGKSLHYHHLDRSTKEFCISRASGRMISKDRLEEELSKCVVLCANCHGEVEDGLVDINDYMAS